MHEVDRLTRGLGAVVVVDTRPLDAWFAAERERLTGQLVEAPRQGARRSPSI